MSRVRKIFIGVLIFLVLVLVIIVAYPNYYSGGNKSVYPVSDSVTTSHETSSEGEEEAPKVVPPTKDSTTKALQHSFQFTAFKTPEKVGVNGTFEDISLDNVSNSDKLEEALTGATFTVNTESLNTNDATNVRDPKLKEFFFHNLAGGNITGKFNSFSNGKANVTITLNGVTKTFDFPSTQDENSINFSGTIDVVKDFNATKALDAVAEACKVLHQDKTWPDVNIKVTINR